MEYKCLSDCTTRQSILCSDASGEDEEVHAQHVVQLTSPSSGDQNACSAHCNHDHPHQYTTDSGTSNHHRTEWG